MSSRPLRVEARLAALALAAALLAVSGVARGTEPPPEWQCSTDADCPDCTRCASDWSGGTTCVGGAGQCWCHDECVRAGHKSCQLVRAGLPLCGGVCSDDLPTTTMPCGAGDDVYVSESLCSATDADASTPGAGTPGGVATKQSGPDVLVTRGPLAARATALSCFVVSLLALVAISRARARRRGAFVSLALALFVACGTDEPVASVSPGGAGGRSDAGVGGRSGAGGTHTLDGALDERATTDAPNDAPLDGPGDAREDGDRSPPDAPVDSAPDSASDVETEDAISAESGTEAGVLDGSTDASPIEGGSCVYDVQASTEAVAALTDASFGSSLCPALECGSWTAHNPWLTIELKPDPLGHSVWGGDVLLGAPSGWFLGWKSTGRAHLLRIDGAGAALGAPRSFPGDSSLGLAWSAAGVAFWASVAPYYAPDGYKQAVWVMSPNLGAVRQGFLLRSADAMVMSRSLSATSDGSGQLLGMARDRTEMLVESVAIADDGALEQRQHWLGGPSSSASVQWLGESLGVAHVSGSDVVFTRLDRSTGAVLGRTTLLPLPPSGYCRTQIAIASDKVWVAIYDIPTEHVWLLALDWSGIPTAPPVEIDWSPGSFYGIRASDTSVALFGGLTAPGTPLRPRLVVVSSATGAYRDQPLPLPSGTADTDYVATDGAFGACGLGTATRVWNASAQRLYFTRLGCP